mgnify:CR=1 FL=1
MDNSSKKDSLPVIIFGFNKDWELRNWYDSCTKKITYDALGNKKWDLGGIPQEIKTVVKEEGIEKTIKNKIENIFNRFLEAPKASRIIQDATERAKKRWNEAGTNCIFVLSKMLEIPIEEFEQNYVAYFTFGKRIPFYENRFMFNQFSDFPNTAAHEIMHIEFLKKYKKYCLERGLDETQISHLKEILTVLLNEDMEEFLYLSDRGYDIHKEIRKEVLKLYRDHKKIKQNFTVFLDKVINLLKNQWEYLIAV